MLTSPAAPGRIATIEEIRAQFPALARLHNGHPVAYFDGPGGTQVPRAVGEAVLDYLYHHNANTHWAYPTSNESDEIIANARQALADFLNAASPDEIAFGANMTSLTFHFARALGREWGAGDEVVITELDHHGNVGPWQAIAKERGVTLRVVKMIPQTGQLDYEDLARCITKKTKLLAIGGASNALGTINDLPRAIGLAHAAGALVYADAVHYAPHELVDVQALDCDFMGCSTYKFYGTHLGVVYAKRALLESISFPKLIPAPDAPPDVAETGTQNHEGIAGALAAVDFLASLGYGATRSEKLQTAFAGLHPRGIALVTRLWNGLAANPRITLYGPTPDKPRTPTVAFTVKGETPEATCKYLAQKGLFLSHGNFYAKTVIERLGLEPHGLVRAGCACYASEEEVDRLLAALR